MQPRVLSPAKAVRTLRKTPVLLAAALAGVTPAQFGSLRDGVDGWTIHEIVHHLRAYETALAERVQLLLTENDPVFPVVASLSPPAPDTMSAVPALLARLHADRAALLVTLEGLTDAQWERAGTHPQQGAATLLDVAINAGLHDVDHIEQILHCRPPAPDARLHDAAE